MTPPTAHAGAGAPAHATHESFDLDTGFLGWFSVGLVVLIVLSAVIAFALLGGFRIPQPERDAAQPRQIARQPGAAALQSAPVRDLRMFREEKAPTLEQYAWIDRSRGVVRIPIERAMELAARGAALPAGAEQRR